MTVIILPVETDGLDLVPGRPDLFRRRVTGSPREVAATVAMVGHAGHLVSATAPRQLDASRVTILMTLRDTPAAPARLTQPAPGRTVTKPLLITGGVLAALAGIGFGAYYLAGLTVRAAAAASPVALGVLATAVVVLLLIGRRGVSCSGLHCGGCRNH